VSFMRANISWVPLRLFTSFAPLTFSWQGCLAVDGATRFVLWTWWAAGRFVSSVTSLQLISIPGADFKSSWAVEAVGPGIVVALGWGANHFFAFLHVFLMQAASAFFSLFSLQALLLLCCLKFAIPIFPN